MWSGLIVWLGIWRVETPVQVVVRVEWLVLVDVFRFWSLIYGRPLTPSPLPRRGEGTIVRLSKHRRVVVWVRAGETGYSFLIQNTASPMSPDHRSSGRFLVGAPFGVSQFLFIVVL